MSVSILLTDSDDQAITAAAALLDGWRAEARPVSELSGAVGEPGVRAILVTTDDPSLLRGTIEQAHGRGMPVIVGVALGGALGASARYGLDHLIEQRSDSVFPWATFAINLSGCFLIGLVSATLIDRHHLPAWVRVGLVMGVIGGYTTFSTYAQEALDLVDARDVAEAVAYIGGSVLLGIVAVYLGRNLGRTI